MGMTSMKLTGLGLGLLLSTPFVSAVCGRKDCPREMQEQKRDPFAYSEEGPLAEALLKRDHCTSCKQLFCRQCLDFSYPNKLCKGKDGCFNIWKWNNSAGAVGHEGASYKAATK